MPSQHGLHNEQACNHLFASGQYHDWVVTTAFYAAMHFCYHQIFPLTENGKTYASFEQYYQAIPGKKPNKHQATLTLVFKHLNKAYTAYKWLHDRCFTARYQNYQTTQPEAVTARTRLATVKSFCTKP
jgi:hypothetical protein